MTTTTFRNRINVTFNIIGKGEQHIDNINKVQKIASNHNAQVNLFNNKSSLKFDTKGNVIGEQMGNIGGTITFHKEDCDHKAAAEELISFLKSLGLVNENYAEVIKTHRNDGTPYKMPQYFIKKV